MQKLVITSFLILFGFAACDIYRQDQFQSYYVVESYLVAGYPLPQVRLSRTAPIDDRYEFEDVAVNDADVEVQLLDRNGNVEETIPYNQSGLGVYIAISLHRVLPERRYRLRVEPEGSGDVITATTLVPGPFESVGNVVDAIEYQNPEQIEIVATRSRYPGRQSFFIFNVNAHQPQRQNLTPFYADLVIEQEEDIRNYYANSSGIVNEENYDQNEDGTLTLRLPWLAVAFYGDNDIVANAIDDNIYDFHRSQDAQGGGETLAPGEYQNVIYNVEGGIGVFGSMSSDTVTVKILRRGSSGQSPF